jgi:hypothetical protein
VRRIFTSLKIIGLDLRQFTHMKRDNVDFGNKPIIHQLITIHRTENKTSGIQGVQINPKHYLEDTCL